MTKRLFGIFGVLSVVLGPAAFVWLAIHYVFGEPNLALEALAFLALFGPPALCYFFYRKEMHVHD